MVERKRIMQVGAMKRSGVLTKLRITVGEIDLPALQIWIVANFVSMALILILGIRLGYLLFASHADFFSWKFLGAALVANAWLIAAAALARIIMVGMAYRSSGRCAAVRRGLGRSRAAMFSPACPTGFCSMSSSMPKSPLPPRPASIRLVLS